MKSETAIKVHDDPYAAGLRERLLRGTAARLCPPLRRVPTYPVIVSGEVDGLSEIARVQHNMARWMEGAFGPLYMVYLFILSRFGFGPLSKDKMAAFDAIMSDAKTMAENAKYWQAAVERMFAQARRARAKGREFTPPDWFVWLDRYDLSISPARVKSLMAALSVKGRVAVMGLGELFAEIGDGLHSCSGEDSLFPVILGLDPRIHPFAGCTDPAVDPPIKSGDDERYYTPRSFPPLRDAAGGSSG